MTRDVMGSVPTARRLMVMADLYNVFNSDSVFSQNNTLGTNYNLRPGGAGRPTS